MATGRINTGADGTEVPGDDDILEVQVSPTGPTSLVRETRGGVRHLVSGQDRGIAGKNEPDPSADAWKGN